MEGWDSVTSRAQALVKTGPLRLDKMVDQFALACEGERGAGNLDSCRDQVRMTIWALVQEGDLVCYARDDASYIGLPEHY